MTDDANPYRSPPAIESPIEANARESSLWGVCFGCGIGFAGLGILAAFLRNVPALGFFLIALVLLLIVVVASRRHRKRASIALAMCFFLTAIGLYQIRVMQARIAVQRAREMRAAAEAANQAARAAAGRPSQSGNPTVNP